MPPPDYATRQSMTQYLLQNYRLHWRTDMITTAGDLDDWFQEISTFLRDAAAEYPPAHPDRVLYEAALVRLTACYTGFTRFRRDLLGRSPTVVVNQIDTVYASTGLDAVVPLPAEPLNHDRHWTGNNFLFIESAEAIDAIDINSLYSAMIQDPNNGNSTNVGGQLRHQTANATGNTAGMIWYVHQYGRNRLLAVGGCNPANRTVTMLRSGDVNAGVHRF